MICHSIELKYCKKIVKGFGFLSFAENRSKDISKTLSCKYSTNLICYSRQSNTDALNMP